MTDPVMHLNWGNGAAALGQIPENLVGKIVTVRVHVISDCATSTIVEQRHMLV